MTGVLVTGAPLGVTAVVAVVLGGRQSARRGQVSPRRPASAAHLKCAIGGPGAPL
ncbi:hypothetical protein ACQP1O_11545 [Nocardia sp. CA-151230]|uniref:hypothetical protein n=1 Tax=Nocardia sp. CA-151230 TaxID=3239982 RepID=UPI003D8AD5A4